MKRSHQNRGSALGIVIITGVVFSIAAFSVLTMSFSGASHPAGTTQSFQARYAAEAGLVRASQRLWTTPTYCGETWSRANSGLAYDVVITVSPPCAANTPHEIRARVTYATS